MSHDWIVFSLYEKLVLCVHVAKLLLQCLLIFEFDLDNVIFNLSVNCFKQSQVPAPKCYLLFFQVELYPNWFEKCPILCVPVSLLIV